MYLFMWIAAAWLVAAVIVTLVFFGAKRSQFLQAWLFGEKPSAEVRHLTIPTTSVETTRLAA